MGLVEVPPGCCFHHAAFGHNVTNMGLYFFFGLRQVAFAVTQIASGRQINGVHGTKVITGLLLGTTAAPVIAAFLQIAVQAQGGIGAHIHVEQVIITHMVVGVFHQAAGRKFWPVNPKYILIDLRIANAFSNALKIPQNGPTVPFSGHRNSVQGP